MFRQKDTIDDVFNIQSFFALYKERKPADFAELFGETTAADIETLDFAFSDYYGGRVLLEKYSAIFDAKGAASLVMRLVDGCNAVYKDAWLKCKAAVLAAYGVSLADMGGETKTIVEQKNSTDNGETQNKTNAYDDTETAANTDSSTKENAYEHAIQRTETIQKDGQKDLLELARDKLDFVKLNDWLLVVFGDIADYCSTVIY